jgi:hypothetical protein
MSPRAARRSGLALLLLSLASPLACGAKGEPSSQDAGQASGAQPVPTTRADGAASRAPTPTPSPATAAATTAPSPPSSLPSRARADAMSTSELVQRRDLWPSRVKLLQEVRLDPTTWWRAGEELPLSSWDGASVYLDEGSFVFDAPAELTDVEARARDVAAALTPEALALTVPELVRRPELWPLRLKVTARLEFASNSFVPAGREVALRFFEGEQLNVYDRELANYYTVAANETDVMAQARERLKLPADQRTPFFLRSLEAALEPRAGGGAVSLTGADYVLVFAGRLGCTRCQAFAPQVKEFYAKAQAGAPAGSRFELVLLPEDSNAESARRYVAELGLPGGVIAFDKRLEAAHLMAQPLQILPGLFVFDRNGNVVARNDANAGRPSADEVLAQFAAQVQGAAPR